jgi:uncharacterized delta-60 repeat protein
MFARFNRTTWKASLLAVIISMLAFTIALAASGDLDTTFDGDGMVTTEIIAGQWNWIGGVALQSNGKIVVAGDTYVSGLPHNFGLARYNTNGALDTTFSSDGLQVTNVGGFDQGLSVAIQTDGKIVVAGQKCNNTGTICDVAVVRYKAGGALDTSFSGDGKQTDDFGGNDNGAFSARAFNRWKIVIGGYMFNTATNNYDFAVYRYTTNGALILPSVAMASSAFPLRKS